MPDYTSTIDKLLKQLFPIHRSISGKGNRDTLEAIQEIVPLDILEYPSGEKVYDWEIPKEWSIRDAWIKDSNGRKIIDLGNSNLHIVNYSSPVRKKASLEELKKHLYFIEELPNAIPYRTSYYKSDWGFCLSYNSFMKNFHKGNTYEVYIDSDFTDGSISIGEFVVPGKQTQEHLISTYICHPSMANDNLSGIIITALIAKELSQKKLNYSYRFVFLPETIGAISYCANNEDTLKKIKAGFVITTGGGPGPFGYKQSFDTANPINYFIEQTFQENNISYKTYPFCPYGSDERQYSSQGFRINTASITKDKYYEYEYYHTSLDNLDFVKPEFINQTLNIYIQAIQKLDKNLTYLNTQPYCESMLSKYNLYPKTGGGLKPAKGIENGLHILLWLLFYCDGSKTLLDIAKQLEMPLELIYENALLLENKGLLKIA